MKTKEETKQELIKAYLEISGHKELPIVVSMVIDSQIEAVQASKSWRWEEGGIGFKLILED